MSGLPDCTDCDSRNTLEVTRVDPHTGLRWCVCSCCAQEVLIDATGAVIRRIRPTPH